CQIPREREKARPLLAKGKEEKPPCLSSTSCMMPPRGRKPLPRRRRPNQLLPANDSVKFANRYCELKYPMFANSRNLYLEQTLKIPEELQQYTSDQIKQRGWFFLERPLTEVNASWVREFYCNYFKTSLDVVNLRGKQILVTEEAIEDVLKLLPKTDQTDGYQKAEEDMRFMKFDWDA
ncbi:hypothetical protein HN51_059171, partial [Arachis hypogaea]